MEETSDNQIRITAAFTPTDTPFVTGNNGETLLKVPRLGRPDLMPNSAHGSTSVSEDEAGEPAELRQQPRGSKALFKRQPEPQ
ncbi:Hypothetical predicted protein [Pelobates cultripes]|uniref:Uncharacterized protein n=1 Tax=Pelobates cultripes TaxID=61616 RepID=A0AAD1R095_PELCU|nr:Hypothetical predicted protein [Pelobates cultripes]